MRPQIQGCNSAKGAPARSHRPRFLNRTTATENSSAHAAPSQTLAKTPAPGWIGFWGRVGATKPAAAMTREATSHGTNPFTTFIVSRQKRCSRKLREAVHLFRQPKIKCFAQMWIVSLIQAVRTSARSCHQLPDFRRCRDAETHAFAVLQKTHHLEEIGRSRIAGRAEHPHQALGGHMRRLSEFRESDGGIDVIAEDGLAGGDVARQQAFDALAQQRLPKLRI